MGTMARKRISVVDELRAKITPESYAQIKARLEFANQTLSVPVVAEVLGASVHHVARLFDEGTLTGGLVKTEKGRHVRLIDVKSVSAFVTNQIRPKKR